jgi:hypothetical protein
MGDWFEERGDHNEIVLGYDVAKRLAVIEDLELGDEFAAKIRLYGEVGRPKDKTAVFKIVGILKSSGDEHDNQVLVGITEAKELDEKDAYDGLFVKVDDPAFTASVSEKIEGLGLTAHSAQDVIDEVNRLMVAVTVVFGFFFRYFSCCWCAYGGEHDDYLGLRGQHNGGHSLDISGGVRYLAGSFDCVRVVSSEKGGEIGSFGCVEADIEDVVCLALFVKNYKIYFLGNTNKISKSLYIAFNIILL